MVDKLPTSTGFLAGFQPSTVGIHCQDCNHLHLTSLNPKAMEDVSPSKVSVSFTISPRVVRQ